MTRLKIIIIGPQPPIRGGIAEVNRELCHLLSRRNRVIGIGFSKLYPSFFFPSNNAKIEESPSYTRITLLDTLNPFTWEETVQYILKEKPDVVLFHWWTTYLFLCYGYLAMRLQKKIRLGALIHNTYPHGVIS